MGSPGYIRQRFRDEFEATGIEGVRDQIKRGTIDAEKRVQALTWIDEKVHGEDRAYRARQIEAAERSASAAERSATASELSAQVAVKANRRAIMAAVVAFAGAAYTWWPVAKPYLIWVAQKILG